MNHDELCAECIHKWQCGRATVCDSYTTADEVWPDLGLMRIMTADRAEYDRDWLEYVREYADE